MPFRQSLRSAFLKFPCGHGGSQFTSQKEEPGMIPSSRIYPPQTGPSDVVSAPSSTIPKTRRTPGVHKDPSNFLGAEEIRREQQNGRINGGIKGGIGEVKRQSAIGPEYDPPEDVSRGYIGDPTLDHDDFDQHSPPRNEYRRRPSAGTHTSDYSNHSITHSLHPMTPSTSNRGINASPSDHAKPHDLAKPRIEPQTSAAISTTADIERDISDLNLGERQLRHVPRGENLDEDLKNDPGMINDRKRYNQLDAGERRESWEQDPSIYRTISKEDDKEDGHKHKHAGLCADEIAQGITSKQSIPATTTVKTKPLEPIIHTRIQPREHEEVTNVITRETHTTHIHPTIQPIIDQTHLPQKHYLEGEPGSNKLVEISAEQAERNGWDEVWHGNWTVGDNNAMRYEREMEKVKPGRRGGQKVIEQPYEGSYDPEGPSYEMYGSGEVMRDSATPTLVEHGRGRYTDARRKEKVERLHMPGSYGSKNVLVGPAY